MAELSSAILGAELGLPVAHLDHHASYIASWLELLRSDDRAILPAAAKAEEAASLLPRLGDFETRQTSRADSDLASRRQGGVAWDVLSIIRTVPLSPSA